MECVRDRKRPNADRVTEATDERASCTARSLGRNAWRLLHSHIQPPTHVRSIGRGDSRYKASGAPPRRVDLACSWALGFVHVVAAPLHSPAAPPAAAPAMSESKSDEKRASVPSSIDENPKPRQPTDLAERRRLALAEIDNAKFSWFHARIALIAGVGFFTDAYVLRSFFFNSFIMSH
jgi:hypothetical protein